MLIKKLTFLFFICTLISSLFITSKAAVILQYHHVSDSTPKSTSISPKQFEVHLQYLADEQFNVIPLPQLVNALKNKQSLPDKTVAITFDDAYSNILSQAKPILDKFKFPYTIFINPQLINSSPKPYLSWDQITTLSDLPNQQVTIANHGLTHDSFARQTKNKSKEEWFTQQTNNLLLAESIIEEHTGKSFKFFAYPYGEYTSELQHWLNENDFVAFTQQSGAVGLSTDLTAIPRFPASQPYDQIASLKDKLYSMPLDLSMLITDTSNHQSPITTYSSIKDVTFNVKVEDFNRNLLTCYISGIGKQEVEWISADKFTLTFSKSLPIGRVRSNCTAPSIEKSGRFYWFSQPWFVLNADGSWYPL
ncbi:polysaccharide deacetylase family protein [Pseudocolwellia sp. AS88]|uniref:polysaccharide deacetylase family protein n=1 Tax=Pseudocolwellia sp. AS88 TaxID=3063958 RepID=UPI0026F24009|nr:polysaccharide deacetylase family protein [Pseudocolwellia sp. AS88]MDO7084146.1 polysaccharide deacetylase family protein [Pseudocolwellia sp. AS88]